jgi:HemY protein
MRAALWLLALFGIAAAVALFAGNNPGTVTLFWPPTRVDLSLNLALVVLVLLFLLLHFALRALAALFQLPSQARQWRQQQKERALHGAVLDAVAQLLAGRFTRARRAAEAALAQERQLAALRVHLPQARRVRILAHLLAAEGAQSLQDRAARDAHLEQALDEGKDSAALPPETREGLQLRAARWALEDRDPAAALARLAELPQGAQRRTLALRLRLKAARQDQRTPQALETARLLAKHGAFSPAAARGIVRGLAIDLIVHAHDPDQLRRSWSQLEAAERAQPEVALQAAQRLIALGGDPATARAWLLPVWDSQLAHPQGPDDAIGVKLVRTLESALDAVDADWLARIESAQRTHPRDASLQYLAGIACQKRQLWGKAQQLLAQAAPALSDPALRHRAWTALARLAEARGDDAEAAQSWKRAAQALNA